MSSLFVPFATDMSQFRSLREQAKADGGSRSTNDAHDVDIALWRRRDDRKQDKTCGQGGT